MDTVMGTDMYTLLYFQNKVTRNLLTFWKYLWSHKFLKMQYTFM